MKTKEINGVYILYPEKSLYDKEMLFKCLYWYGADFDVDISEGSTKCYCIKLQPRNNAVSVEEKIAKLKRDLIDYQLRQIVHKETKAIRDLLIAKAFAYYDLKEDQNPGTEISDPIGFDPVKI